MDRQITEEILLEYGIHVGYEESRRELAKDLERRKLTGLDLRMVMDHVRDSGTEKSAGARISSVLSDRNRCGRMLVDLRKMHKYRHAKEAKKKQQEPGQWLREQDQARTDAMTKGESDATSKPGP